MSDAGQPGRERLPALVNWDAVRRSGRVSRGRTGESSPPWRGERTSWSLDQSHGLPRHVDEPGRGPRNSEVVSPDGELATLKDYLHNYRLTLRLKCEDLDAEQLARRSVPPSTMSLLGLVRHLAEVERDWRNWIIPGDPLPSLYGGSGVDFDGAVAEPAVVESAWVDLTREQAATDAVLAEHPDLGERLGKDGITVRELLIHQIEEYARHCGHADLLRECIDGRVGQ